MADQEQSAMEHLRNEIGRISAQIENITKNFEKSKSGESNELLAKLLNEVSSLKQSATDRAQQMYKAGQTGAEEVGEHVRRNPLSSLLIAFGAGCIISTILRQLGK